MRLTATADSNVRRFLSSFLSPQIPSAERAEMNRGTVPRGSRGKKSFADKQHLPHRPSPRLVAPAVHRPRRGPLLTNPLQSAAQQQARRDIKKKSTAVAATLLALRRRLLFRRRQSDLRHHLLQ